MAFAMYGMAVVVAPAIGPTLGGWITDNYSWRWIFYINVPISILSLYLTHRFVEDPPYLREEQAEAQGRGHRLHRARAGGAGHRLPADGDGQGAGAGLVRLALDYGGNRRGRRAAGFLDLVGMAAIRIRSWSCSC